VDVLSRRLNDIAAQQLEQFDLYQTSLKEAHMHIVTSLASFFDHVPAWIAAATSLVTAASAITAVTPTPKDDKVMNGILNLLNVVALNVGHAKRADPGE
jgi:hypothetical protein